MRIPRMASFLRLWGWPLALGLLTASGLVAALLSDQAGDAWSWVALGVPVAVMAWHGLRRPARTDDLQPHLRETR